MGMLRVNAIDVAHDVDLMLLCMSVVVKAYSSDKRNESAARYVVAPHHPLGLWYQDEGVNQAGHNMVAYDMRHTYKFFSRPLVFVFVVPLQ